MDYNNFEAYKIAFVLGILTKNSFSLLTSDTQKYAKEVKTFFAKPVVDFAPELIKCNENGEMTTTDREELKTYTLNMIENWCFNYEILKNFFINTIDLTLPPKTYPVSDLRYIPFIMLEYSKNENFVKDVCITSNILDNSIFEKSYNNVQFLNFKITVDISTLFPEIIQKNKNKSKIKIKNSKDKKKKKYSKQQKKIYNYLENYVKSYNLLRIERDLILGDLKLKNHNKSFSDFNDKYKEINNTDESLIKYDRYSGYYIIANHWNINKLSVSV